ncbi:MAG: DUF1501 domain-containing protein [Planctomycetaceae bacterium]|nr:DUF1501 domain-containing protein [Planctomycetaceae bacterium]
MLTMLGSGRRCCDGITRRETLQAGSLALLGSLGIPGIGRAATAPQPTFEGKAKNVILLYLLGGAPTQDMWDLKPKAPSEVRGEFNPIPTNVPGIDICEHLPRMSQWMHKAAIVRSLNHTAGCHNCLPGYTGLERSVDTNTTSPSYPPSMGSVVSYLTRGQNTVPPYVYLPAHLGWGQLVRRPGPYAGYLGQKYDPLFSQCAPFIDKPPEVRDYPQVLRGMPVLGDSELQAGITVDRLNTRQTLLSQLDDEFRRAGQQAESRGYSGMQLAALDLLTRSKVKAAFDVSQEDPALQDRYGKYLFGSSTLVARRLLEAGVRFVNVTWDCYWERLQLQNAAWDTHWRAFGILKEYNLPWFDMTYTALMEDLEARGLLDETLVVTMSEMGRSYWVNKEAGREHWTHCYSVMLAGAGIRGGSVYGASDDRAAYVFDKPVSTGDICATVFQALGIDPTTTTVPDATGGPHHLANGGQPLWDILA